MENLPKVIALAQAANNRRLVEAGLERKYIDAVIAQYRTRIKTQDFFRKKLVSACNLYRLMFRLRDFVVVCDDTNNPPSYVNENVFPRVNIYLKFDKNKEDIITLCFDQDYLERLGV